MPIRVEFKCEKKTSTPKDQVRFFVSLLSFLRFLSKKIIVNFVYIEAKKYSSSFNLTILSNSGFSSHFRYLLVTKTGQRLMLQGEIQAS